MHPDAAKLAQQLRRGTAARLSPRHAAVAVVAAAVMTTATIMLAGAVAPTVAMGGVDGLPTPATTRMSSAGNVHAASIVDGRRWAMPSVPQAMLPVVQRFVTNGTVAIDQTPMAPKSSAKSPAHATQTVKAQPKTRIASTAKAASVVPSGVNHFWFPSLGISDKVHTFDCAGSYVLPGGIWHFGCNGVRNIYLMAHAWSDFKAVRAAYNNGTLHTGMTAYYAGPNGTVVRYKVAWIRRVTVEQFNAGYWVWAINDVPAVTLQTCDGAHSEYRIIVRLVRG